MRGERTIGLPNLALVLLSPLAVLILPQNVVLAGMLGCAAHPIIQPHTQSARRTRAAEGRCERAPIRSRDRVRGVRRARVFVQAGQALGHA